MKGVFCMPQYRILSCHDRYHDKSSMGYQMSLVMSVTQVFVMDETVMILVYSMSVTFFAQTKLGFETC